MDRYVLPPDTPDVLTSREVAHIFRVSSMSVVRWTHAGLLPSFRTRGGEHRGDCRFRRADVQALLDAGFTPRTNEPPPVATVRTAATPAMSAVLGQAADLVAALPHRRVTRNQVSHSLRLAASSHGMAQQALAQVIGHLRAAGRLDLATHWPRPRDRDQVAADLRTAADTAEAEQERSP